ncbi:hypothetical protein PHMEG_00023351 [Phytophthora megakarya]|uniref:DDE-1 domain-containing protein n=1 Tax=Phytophthora megakarya TaxID=4795 RepID=A0A225VGK8_9STRA|nr:hypothetical protein PHMEG_00023351 [Phytophthora megakarya]
MKYVRRLEGVLSTAGIIQFMWQIQPEWIEHYLSEKTEGEAALDRMVQRLAHGKNSTIYFNLKSYEDLEETRAEFSLDVWSKYAEFEGGGVLNVDEMTIMFDSWAGKGRKNSARIPGQNKHADRMTAVRTVRDDGYKLPIRLIIRSVPGADNKSYWEILEKNELKEYPDDHFYAVHKTWMDASVWKLYVDKLLNFEIDTPTVLIVDKFDCHVSEKEQRAVADEDNATPVPLPPNRAAVCQPLDVGVTGPLNKIRNRTGRITGGTAKEKRLRALEPTISAWNS